MRLQTFLPYDDFSKSAASLDYRRLGKQRVEALQIYNALTVGGGWKNHPAVRMWSGHLWWLLFYAIEMCLEWISRGYRDTMLSKFIDMIDELGDPGPLPSWLGLSELHTSHRGNLIRKDESYYRSLGWTEEPMNGYWWPTHA